MRKLLICAVVVVCPQVALADPFEKALACHELVEQRLAAEAVSACSEALSAGVLSEQNAARTFNNRGRAKLRLEQYSSAQSDFARALELAPAFAQAFNNRGVARARMGDTDGARRDFDAAIAHDERYAHAFYNRALLSRDTSEVYGALADIDRALKLQPKLMEARAERRALIAELGAAPVETAEIEGVDAGTDRGDAVLAEALEFVEETPAPKHGGFAPDAATVSAARVAQAETADLSAMDLEADPQLRQFLSFEFLREDASEHVRAEMFAEAQAKAESARLAAVRSEVARTEAAIVAASAIAAQWPETVQAAAPAFEIDDTEFHDMEIEVAAVVAGGAGASSQPERAFNQKPRTKIVTGDLQQRRTAKALISLRSAPEPAAAPSLASLEAAMREGRLDVARTQARLVALGYNPGPIDGAYGPKTRAALSRCLAEDCALNAL